MDDKNNKICIIEQDIIKGNNDDKNKESEISLGIQKDALHMVQTRLQQGVYNCELVAGILTAFPTADFLDLRLSTQNNIETSIETSIDTSIESSISMILRATSSYHRWATFVSTIAGPRVCACHARTHDGCSRAASRILGANVCGYGCGSTGMFN